MISHIRRFVPALLVATTVLAAATGCGSPAAPSTPYVASAQYFSGVITVGGTSSYAISPPEKTLYLITLGSLTSAANEPLSSTVALSMGTLSGTDCTPFTTVTVGKALVAQITQSLDPGLPFCVSVTDTGSLQQDANFFVRIVSVTGSRFAPVPVATTETFTSNVFPSTSAARSFTTDTTNPITLTLQSTATPGVVLGLSVGVRDLTTCHITSTVKTAAGASAQLTINADAGVYCVIVSDPGTLTAPTSFTASINHF
jgi:hypothetical protein